MPNESVDKCRLKDLIVKRSSAKGQITKFKHYLGSISKLTELNTIQITELRLKLAKFEALSVRTDDLQNEIEVLNSDNLEAELDERESIECDIMVNIATAKTLVDKFSKNECEHRRGSVHDNSCCSDNQAAGVKLPQIQIAKFDGSYFRWLEFRDTFESLIHRNEHITSIQKFHYLMSYLEGDAARIITNLEVSTANYSEAWKLLCNRYNNKRVLVNHHYNSLVNFKQITRESERSLRFLVDHVKKNLRALASLGQPTDQWDGLLIFILSEKLDSNTMVKWEEYTKHIDEDNPTLEQFYKFMTDRAEVLESLNRNKQDNSLPKCHIAGARSSSTTVSSQKRFGQNTHTKSFAASNTKLNKSKNTNTNSSNAYLCVICNDNHRIFDCPTFKAKGIDERMLDVNKYKLCVNCLRQGHHAEGCRLGPCRECNKRHHSLLHRPTACPDANSLVAIDERNYNNGETIASFSNRNSCQTLLSTAMIEVSNPLTQQKEKVRALLDCGSQSSFISKALKDRLSVKSISIDSLKVVGIGNTVSSHIAESCNVQIKSLDHKYIAKCYCLVLKELTGFIPKYPVNINSLNLPKNIVLADPTFGQPAPIDVLIGVDLFWDILGDEQRSLGPRNPKLINTQLGWIISGPINPYVANKNIYCNKAIVSNQNDFEKSLCKFWELEEVPIKRIMSEDEKFCENHFIAHTRREITGRFCVNLPLKDTPDCLGDTYNLAKKRLHYLEKRFRKNPLLKSEYAEFINEYAELGHLSSAKEIQGPSYYLCHHAVLKQESESTKLRVVFDGSAASTSGYALNDILMVGPTLQESLFAILIRARQYKFLLTGDIEKMYRQVLVAEKDRCLQRILWRENESQPIRAYDLNTLTYGTASASYLSTRCLWQLGEEQDDDTIKCIIQKDFYVDDLITGADNAQDLRYIQKSVSEALKKGCFNLRKYKSNNPLIFENLNLNQDNLTISESSSTLGLGWTPSSDTLFFPIKSFTVDKQATITKRFVMSNSFKIFDPLGILSPVIIQPKILLQKMWQQKLDWDEPVPREMRDDWLKFTENLEYLHKFQIPRLVLCDKPELIELHSFSDASQCAYGACIYLKSTNGNGDSTIKLLCAKSKVSPVKPTTIPRLELCAALLAAKLCKSVVDSLRCRPGRLVHWCDSSVVLSWINSDPTKLKMFAANRVCEIVELTKASSWRYVPTAMNPADLISRGVDAKNLLSMELWWSGPSFLRQNESKWPLLKECVVNDLPELKTFTSIVNNNNLIDFNNFTSFNKLRNLIARCRRFIFNMKHPNNKRVGTLTADELRESFHSLCVIAQRESFPIEYDLLIRGKQLPARSKVLSLSPFLDNDNLIRVGGRINASACNFEKRHPILLHASHKLTKLYFDKEHLVNLHAGPQLLLATVRETVWPINGKHLARRTANNCVRCRRLSGRTLCPKMGDLPSQRVNPDYPFLSVGLDFAGPFFILNRKGRGSRLIKCYMCIFVCLRYKCIHLEAVSDLTKDAFVMTLRRFIARRGKPSEIFSDNGRNFVAAAKEIGDFLKQNTEPISDFASQQGIKFNFIPTYAPHFGGIWEAGVKSAKYHIKRVIGNSNLTFEEIITLFAQVEAILNSRPLCPLSSSPNDLLSLSPGHFIIGRPLTALPLPALAEKDGNQYNRYKRLETIRQHFWQRWQKEYLSELQQRTKWRKGNAQLNVGDMVLLAEDNTPPLSWRLGRVLRLFPGPDGVARVAEIKTPRGCVRRPFTRLCPLPTAEELNG